MLYSGKGDKGTTTHLKSATRIPKDDPVIEALGELDELGALLGVCKLKTDGTALQLIERLQQHLFIAQAQIAGANKKITSEKTQELEVAIDEIELKLPPINTFLVAGGTELSAFLDYARAVSRRVERRIVTLALSDPEDAELLVYMNRLSSLLYALARLSNEESGITEKPPTYE